jgi:RNA polymerase sigma factor (sigma-70 family)
MKHIIKYKSDAELVSEYQQNLDCSILEHLLDKHNSLIFAVSKKHFLKHKNIDFEDCLQNAKIAAIDAINSFDFSKENKFTTFLYFKMSKYLLTCNDEQNFIKCPSHMREVRSYIAGKYDLDQNKKQKFEKKHQINNNQDFSKLKKENILLKENAVISVPKDSLPETLSGNELDCVENINNTIFMKSLPKDEQEIVDLLMQGYSQNKISEILGFASTKQINSKVNSIRKKVVKYYYG